MIAEFMEHLKELEPLPNDVQLEVAIVKKANLGKGVLGSPILALFEAKRGERWAKLTVAATGKNKREILSSLGHEYYHAVQWFRDGRFCTLADGVDAFVDYESDAEGFGYRSAMGWGAI